MSDYNTYTVLRDMTSSEAYWDQLPTEDSLFFDTEPVKTQFKTEPYFEEFVGSPIDDDSLLDLAKHAEKTGSLLPLIKEELKCKIQAKRLAAGKEELDVIVDEKPKTNQLSDEDVRKRETRKAQNRRAAKRYRLKQRRLLSADKDEKYRLERENANLLAELNQLREDKRRLIEMLQQHQRECPSREAVVPDWEIDPLLFFN